MLGRHPAIEDRHDRQARPAQREGARFLFAAEEGGTLIPSDLYYQCLDGNFNSDGDGFWGEPTDGPGGSDVDLASEVSIGRISAETPAEMSNQLFKMAAYEDSPPNASCLRKVLIAGEYLGFGGASEYATATMEEIRSPAGLS